MDILKELEEEYKREVSNCKIIHENFVRLKGVVETHQVSLRAEEKQYATLDKDYTNKYQSRKIFIFLLEYSLTELKEKEAELAKLNDGYLAFEQQLRKIEQSVYFSFSILEKKLTVCVGFIHPGRSRKSREPS